MSNISGSFNDSNMNQSNIQGKQKIEINYGIKPEKFEELIQDIHQKVTDDDERDKALYFVEQAKTALKQENKDKAKKMLSWIQGIVGNTASLITIGTSLGMVFT